MSTRADLRAWLGQEAADDARTCAGCGGAWTALWVGAVEIPICPGCAFTILPRLQADAIWRRQLTLAEAERALADGHAEFWRALPRWG
jgi:hypothetical protein